MAKERRTATHILKQHGMSATLADLANLVEAEQKDGTAVADEGGPDRLLGNGLVAVADLDDVIESTLSNIGIWAQTTTSPTSLQARLCASVSSLRTDVRP